MTTDKSSILIIDDDANLRKTLTDILTVKGYKTLAAENGTEGLSLLRQHTVHLALIDLRLPDISGLEVLEKIRDDHPHTEAIILTGNATLDSAIEATNKGAFSYLQKPYDMDQLMLHIRRAIEKQQAEEKIRHYQEHLEELVRERTADLMCAAEEIKESEERFRAIFDNAADGILLADAESKRFYLGNRAISQMLGYSWEEIRSLDVMDLHPKESLSYVMQKFEKASNENINYTNEIPMKRKDGSIFYADISGISITLKGKKYLLGMFRDITERRNAAEALQNALVASEAASKAKSDFLANMSHELTTPLNSVIGFSQILQDGFYGELNDNQKEYVDNILQSGTRLLNIIRNMLNLVRAESGNSELKVNRFLLKDALKSSAAIFNDKSILHNLKLTVEIEPDADIELETDSGKLSRILYNLIDNAVKFTPDGGSVRVSARLTRDEGRETKDEKSSVVQASEASDRPSSIEISVEDTGIGIKPEDIGKLFQPFAQLESPYTKQYSGAGIGLILTKKLVEQLGGRVWAESEFGKGSKFTFVIPVRQKQNSEFRSRESE